MIKLKKQNKVYFKKGISLIVLIVTIVIMLIITTIVVVSVDDVIENSALTSFANDVSIVEDLTKVYYMQNGAFPTKTEDEAAISQNDVLAKVGTQKETAFTDELKLNNDYNNSNGALGNFFIIDLTKLDIDSSTRGFLKDGDQSDVYIVSFPSMNIYYIKGEEVKGINYFSLSSKITDKVKIQKNTTYDSQNDVVIQSIEGLTVKKLTKNWTNSMGISVNVNISTGEDLYLEASGVEKKKLTLNSGYNEFSFNDLSEITGFSSSDSTTFKSSNQQEKKLIFTKQNGSEEIGKLEIDMTNYETTEPTFQVDPNDIVSNENYNMVPFRVFDSISGVKEIRYEYLKKFDENGNVVNYYENVNSFDESFLKSRGKKAIPDEDGNVALKIDKEIEGIQVLVIDKAGNVNTTTFTIGMYENDNIYIGLKLKQNSKEKLSYSMVFVNNKGISDVQVQTSSDGGTYSAPQVITVNSDSSERVKTVDNTHENLSAVVNYLKITAQNNAASNQTICTKVFKLEEKDKLEIGKIAEQSKTYNMKTTGTYYNPVIPKGFAPINVGNAIWGTSEGFNNGLVIQDESGNQFVWVPIESSSDEEFEGKFTTYIWNEDEEEFINYSDTMEVEFDDMKDSVKKNGGFYISRYEAAIEEGGSVSTVNGTQKPVSKENMTVWNNITWPNATKVARSMYPNTSKLEDYSLPTNLTNTSGVISTLVYGAQWDTTLRYISRDYTNFATDSLNGGNYTDSTGSTSSIINTGLNANYSKKNIYDIAGNVNEYTMEVYGENKYGVYRGGAYDTASTSNPASYRGYSENENYTNSNIGFRVALYINN